MTAISIMELNTKSPFIWDWDNLVVYPSKAADAPKKLHLVESEFEGIVDGFEIGSFHSSGGRSDVGSGSGGSASNLAHGSSSKSASVDSSTNRETVRESKFTLETSDCFSQNVSSRKELASAWLSSGPTVTEISIGSGESLIGLKLGRRTYFEDVSAPAPTCTNVKKSKSTSQSNESIRCQVEGCNLDLSSAKDYHRKHRVCENHSKTPKVVISGVERRFCQQCSRFHSLPEFDQMKRSCRRRLSDHNARRRKPKPEIIQFNSMRLPSSLHEGRSLTFNQVPVVQTRPNSNTTWDFTNHSKFTQVKHGLLSPAKSRAIDSMHNDPQDTGFKLSYSPSQILPPPPPKSSTFHQGGNFSKSTARLSFSYASVIISIKPVDYAGFEVSNNNAMDAAQDLGALSLLSTNSWGSQEQEHEHGPASLDQSGMLQLNQTRPGLHAEYNQQFQEFQLFKPPNDPNYYLYEDLR
ncbi:hypothetical protein V2J09_003806 [Rumex salicifolius]